MDIFLKILHFQAENVYLSIMKEEQQYNSELIFTQYLQEVLDHFAACFGIRIAFYDTSGQELKVGMRQGICDYCCLVREELGLLDACRQCDAAWTSRAEAERRLVSYHCHAGMQEMIKPVYLDELLIGYIMIGQFRDRETPEASIRSKWRKKFGSDADLCTAFERAPFFSAAKIAHITGIFEALVDSTVDKHAYQLAEAEPMFRLKNFLLRNIHRNVSLAEAASHLKWSTSSLTHKVKTLTGKSFKQLQIDMKLSLAEQMISERQKTIAEAADAVGFHDPCYFSRLYRKYRWEIPSKLKKDKS